MLSFLVLLCTLALVSCQTQVLPPAPSVVSSSVGVCDTTSGFDASSQACNLQALQYVSTTFSPGQMQYVTFKTASSFQTLKYGGFTLNVTATNNKIGWQVVSFGFGVAPSVAAAQACAVAVYNNSTCTGGVTITGVGLNPSIVTQATQIVQSTSSRVQDSSMPLITTDILNSVNYAASQGFVVFTVSMATIPVQVSLTLYDVQGKTSTGTVPTANLGLLVVLLCLSLAVLLRH